jgi:hypothetical protein
MKRKDFEFQTSSTTGQKRHFFWTFVTGSSPTSTSSHFPAGVRAAYSTESDHRFHAIPITHSIDSGQGVGA